MSARATFEQYLQDARAEERSKIKPRINELKMTVRAMERYEADIRELISVLPQSQKGGLQRHARRTDRQSR